VQVVPQNRERFIAALDLYEQRPDKEYSLTDCISMQVMKAMGITEVLTHDRHFVQEGFIILFP
jgi:predicted nucleic acid-binding protein